MIQGIDQGYSSPFDALAPTFDDEDENNFVIKHVRPIFWQCAMRHFKQGDHVLELNCGTGIDAIHFAKQGIRVTALDASMKMINIAREKAGKLGLNNLLTFHQLNTENLELLEHEPFDGTYSNFGGLNCVPGMPHLFPKLHKLLKPKSYLIYCVLNRYSPWEMISYLLQAKFNAARRRLIREGVIANVGGEKIHVWYYSPSEYSEMCASQFEMKKITGLNIFSPNPNSLAFARKFPGLTKKLLQFDDNLIDSFPFYNFGDHFIIEAERKD